MFQNKAFPAHAGMNRFFTLGVATVLSVPRTRGDEPFLISTCRYHRERSPHTRG